MPVTIRGGVVQLTPVTTSTTATRNYFNSLPPALASVQTGLAIFALFVIARFCAARLYLWLRQLRGANSPDPTRTSILPHHHYQPQTSRPVWAMDDKDRMTAMPTEESNVGVEDFRDEKAPAKKLVIDPNWTNTAFGGGDSMPRPLMARPPPAPPLTPPELSTAVFTFEDRPRPGDDSFMRQPNPDYMSSTSSSVLPSSASSPSIPRRRSYNKTLPIGIPTPQTSSGLSDIADLTFSPSSYPPTSPLLPPAPPTTGSQEIDVKGEIIGVLDGGGAGWTRHTRVYGGGVCLACEASGGDHGGFYGATVRPEEMR
ncbi:hypothetical protein B0J13DRAFT_298042 [Dactylonectria estremocensis]|uniref:Uncharacterized protein n=1 Tax=Dactylonectria estremocensis TaxID=1079267 RepID=A0A9P9EZ18_9HYPO|nr:hypothetical protein B0J13DRAFT_298042 [Dactylonectria estremocensis]